MGGREEGKKRQLREGKLVKILQRNLSIQFMVLPSIQVFHKFAYCEMNTFYKYTIFFFFLFFWIVPDLWDFCLWNSQLLSPPHTDPRSVQCNLQTVVSASDPARNLGPLHPEIFWHCHRSLQNAGEQSSPPKTFPFNCAQYKRKSKSKMFIAWNPWFLPYLVQEGCPSSGVLQCELLCQHFLCSASHLPLLQGFPSFQNMLKSFVLSSPFLIILKHLLF